MLNALLLLLLAEPATDATWWILFADDKGGYWVDVNSGKTAYDPALARKEAKEKAPVDDGRSQLRPPPPRKRFRDASTTTAKGVTVKMLKNCLVLEKDGKREWLTKPMLGGHPALRPDGKVLAYRRWDGKSRMGGKARVEDLVLLDLETRKETVVREKSVLHGFAWSPDGRTLAVGAVGNVALVDPETAKTLATWKLTDIDERLWNHGPTHFVFHPGGRWIATRCVFVGGREAGTEIFGDRHLVLLSEEKTRLVELPETTSEGPIRSKVAKKDLAEGAEETGGAGERDEQR